MATATETSSTPVYNNSWASLAGSMDRSTSAPQETYAAGSSPYRSLSEYLHGRSTFTQETPVQASEVNYALNLQWKADTNQGVMDFARNLRSADNWKFYAAMNAGYGQIANYDVFSAIERDMALKHDWGAVNVNSIGGILRLVLGATDQAGGLGAETKALLEKGSGAVETIKKLANGVYDYAEKNDTNLASAIFGKAANDIWDAAKERFEKIKDKVTGIADSGEAFFDSLKEGFSIDMSMGKSVADALIHATGTVLNKAVSLFRRVFDINEQDIANGSPSAMYRQYVMNVPPTASMVIDPMHRMYNNHVIATTHVLNIIPGNLWYGGFTAREAKTSSYQIEKELQDFEAGRTGTFVFDTDSAIYKMIKYSGDENKRMGWFDPAPMQFQRVYSSLMAKVLGRISNKPVMAMTLQDVTKPSEGLYMGGWGHFSIALGPNCTITETASNSFGSGKLESAVEGLKQSANELYKQFSSGVGTAFGDKAKKAINRAFGADSPISAVASNATMHWPKFWETSDMSRSYTLSFRLESPYGNYQSLIEYVYKPFLALLAMSLPIQTSFYGATTPFVIRCDCPGMFSISEGYVSSIDFRRAPDQNTYNASGLATAIEVNLSITDIDPYLALPIGPASFASNINMATWLDSLCGVGYQEIYSGGNAASKFKTMANFAKLMPNSARGATENLVSKKAWSFFTAGPVR